MSFRTDRYEMNSLSGTVASAQSFATSHVTGEAVHTDAQGHVSGGGVSTQVVYHLKFFLLLPDGKEREVSLQALDANAFSVRDGHRVTVAWLDGRPFHHFHNHTTGQESVNGHVLSMATTRWWSAARPLGLAAYMALAVAMWYFVAIQWKWEKLVSDHPDLGLYLGGDLLGAPILIFGVVLLLNALLTQGEKAECRHLVDRSRARIPAA